MVKSVILLFAQSRDFRFTLSQFSDIIIGAVCVLSCMHFDTFSLLMLKLIIVSFFSVSDFITKFVYYTVSGQLELKLSFVPKVMNSNC